MSYIGSVGTGPSGSNISQKSSNGFGGFAGFGSTSPDTTTPEGLLQLAQSEGGALGDAAQELMHPSTSILSTIGNGFKNAFKGFVDIISTPSEIVAGIIDPKHTVGEAIDQNIRVSDVLLGEPDPEATTMKKVGSFVVRAAVDILTDPLTYLTFGAGEGVFGLRATTKLSLGANAAAKMGVEELAQKAVSKEGQEVFKFLKNVEYQSKGLTVAKAIKGDGEVFGLAKTELNDLLKSTIDAPLDIDYAKKAMSNLLEKFPGLTETLMDKGGIKAFGKNILSGQRINSVRKLIPGMTWIDNVTRPARMAVESLFNPTVIHAGGEWSRMPGEYVEMKQAFKDMAASGRAEAAGKLSNLIQSNRLTVGETKLVMAAIEARKVPADARLAKVFKEALGMSESQYKAYQDAGMAISYRDFHAPHVTVKEKVGSIPFKMPPKDPEKSAALFARKMGDTIAEAKSHGFEGFDENIITAHLRRSFDNIGAVGMKRFVKSVAESFGALESESPSGFVEIGSQAFKKDASKVLSSFPGANASNILEGVFSDTGDKLVFHPAIAKDIENFVSGVVSDDATRQFVKVFDKIQSSWKASVTSLFPAFHGRNAISNVFLHMMDLGVHSFNPMIHATAVNLVYHDRVANKLMKAMEEGGAAIPELGKTLEHAKDAAKLAPESAKALTAADQYAELMGKKMFTDAAGYEWSFGELRQTIKDRGVAFNKDITGAMDLGSATQEEIEKGLFTAQQGLFKRIKRGANPLSPEGFVGYKAGREVARAIEEQARVVDFVANLKNTGDVTLAAQRTKQFLFDYGNLTNFEKGVLKRVMPFYTFTRKNLELQAKSLLHTPGRVAAELTTVNTLGDVLSGGKLTPEEEAALPDWVKNGMNVLKEKRGGTVKILSGLQTPIEQPFQQFQANALLASVSPLIRVPTEQLSGYNFFQGKPLSDVTNAAAFKSFPDPIKEFIGYREIAGKKSDGTPFTWYVSLRPWNMNLVNNLPPTSRVLSSIAQLQNSDMETEEKVMQQLVGARIFSFDIQREAVKRERELQTKMEKLLLDAHVIAQFKRDWVPGEQSTGFGKFK